jgi:hypothetical protein
MLFLEGSPKRSLGKAEDDQWTTRKDHYKKNKLKKKKNFSKDWPEKTMSYRLILFLYFLRNLATLG